MVMKSEFLWKSGQAMLNKILKHKKTGFTLIEVLIVVLIIGVLTSIGVASYNSFNERKKVEVAADNFTKVLRSMQSKAVNGQKDCSVCGGADSDCTTDDGDERLSGWFVSHVNAQQYTTHGECGASSFASRTYNLENDVSVTDFGQIQFLPLGDTALGSGQTAVFINSRGYSVEVQIDENGNVE